MRMRAELLGAGADDAPPPAPRRRTCARERPTSQTVRVGDLVWFPYTGSQWMRGRVLSFTRRGLRVQVMGGKVARSIHVKWSDARWHHHRDLV